MRLNVLTENEPKHPLIMIWQTLSTASPYRTAIAIKQEIEKGRIAEATIDLEQLIDALLSRSEKRALKSQLARLMLHIIKWRTQPDRLSLRWIASIEDARDEIMHPTHPARISSSSCSKRS